MGNYHVDLDSLSENFPPGCDVPALLVEFGGWLRERHRGAVGSFRLQSERFDDYWIENGVDLHPFFAFFIRDATGGQVGYWLHEGSATRFPSIVLVGSEGELLVLAPSLETFLARLASGTTQAPDLDSRGDGTDEGQELSKWLKERADRIPEQALPDLPDLQKWMDQWGREQRKFIDSDAAHRQIADKLRK